VIILLTFTLCGNLHIILGIELRYQIGNILRLDVASFLPSLQPLAPSISNTKTAAASLCSKRMANPNAYSRCRPGLLPSDVVNIEYGGSNCMPNSMVRQFNPTLMHLGVRNSR